MIEFFFNRSVIFNLVILMVFLPLIVYDLFVDYDNDFNESKNEGDRIEKRSGDTTIQE